jgi:hypothetical protein
MPTNTSTWRAPSGKPAMARSKSSGGAPLPGSATSGNPAGGFGDFVFDAQSAAPRKHGMDGDAVQPGRESAALLEAAQGPPRGDKGFLGAVLGRFALAGEAQAQSIDAGRELPVQTLEGAKVAAGRGGDEICRLSGGIHRPRTLQHLNRPHPFPLRLSH